MFWTRAWKAAILVLIVVSPTTASATFVLERLHNVHDRLENPPIPGIPCLLLDIRVAGQGQLLQESPPGCAASREPWRVVWNSDATSGRAQGMLSYGIRGRDAVETARALVVYQSQVEHVDTSLEGVILRALGVNSAADALDREVSARLEWDAAWTAGDCRSVRGGFLVEVDGQRVDSPPSGPLLAAICVLAQASGPSLPDVAGMLLDLLASVESAPFEPAKLALVPVAAPRAPRSISFAPEETLPTGPSLPDATPRAATVVTPGRSEDLASAGEITARAVPGGADAEAAASTRAHTPAAEVEASADAQTKASDATRASPRAPGEARPIETPSDPSHARGPDDDAANPPRDATARPWPTEGEREAPRPSSARPFETRSREPPTSITPPPAPLSPGMQLAVAVTLAGAAWAAFALYQRIARPQALESATRQALHDACRRRAAPATAGELGAEVGIERKLAEYHLHYLVKLGLVRAHAPPDAPRTYTLPGVRTSAEATPLDDRLLAAARGGRTVAEIAVAVGETRSRVDRRLKALVIEGAVRVSREDGMRRYHA